MKIKRQKTSARRNGGMATIMFIALLAIMMILTMVNMSSLARLHRQEKLLEQKQIQRLNSPPTNSVAILNSK